jgi:hypothetical protein
VDPEVVTYIIGKIEERFGKMTVTRGDRHTFLGMNIFFPGDYTVTVTMKSYLQEAITDSGLNIGKVAASPAAKGLFDIKNDATLLPKTESEVFHSIVAKLLYVSLRARPDILLAVSFLCTRVSSPTTHDQMKLKRLLEYLYGTLDLTLTLGADDLGKLQTWVDASYAVHPDMRSHTGGVISMGTGGILCQSTKQKLNTKSSTEAELVGASNYLPNTIWSKFFLEAQGHSIDSNIFEQDNVSAIRLETNGRGSAGRQSRHIDIRYFFMKDRIKEDNIKVRHCATEHMLADFFTKPLQGALFRKFRGILLGYEHVDTLTNMVPSATEERVENNCFLPVGNKVSVVDESISEGTTVTGNNNVGMSTSDQLSHCRNSNKRLESDTWSVVVRKRTRGPTVILEERDSTTKLTNL